MSVILYGATSPIAIFGNHLLQHPKVPLATQRNNKKCVQNSKGMGSRCRLLQPPGPSPLSSPKRGGNRTTEVAGTIATAASLRSRGGGLRSRGGGGGAIRSRGGRGGGGLRSREGPTYLAGAAAAALVSGGMEVAFSRLS